MNMMLRSTICTVQRWKKNRKCVTKNLCLLQQVEYLCWFGSLNRLGKTSSIHWITFQTHWKENSICIPFPVKNLPLTYPSTSQNFCDPPWWGGMVIFWSLTIYKTKAVKNICLQEKFVFLLTFYPELALTVF